VDEVPEMRGLGVIELQRSTDRSEDVIGHAPHLSALDLDVVLDADAGKQSHLLTTQAFDAAASSVDGKASVLRVERGAPRNQELSDLCSRAHGRSLTANLERGAASTPVDAISLSRRACHMLASCKAQTST
jgi:hypothetical protein